MKNRHKANKLETLPPKVTEPIISHVRVIGPDTGGPTNDNEANSNKPFDWETDADYREQTLESTDLSHESSRPTGVFRYMGQTATAAAIKSSVDHTIINKIQALE